MTLKEQGCATRVAVSTVAGGAFGGLVGLAGASWGATPRTRVLSLTKLVGNVQGRAAVLGLVGLTYAATECSFEAFSGGRSAVNAAAGGLAAGMVLGFATTSVATGVTAACSLGLIMGSIEFAGGNYNQKTERNWNKVFDIGAKREHSAEH